MTQLYKQNPAAEIAPLGQGLVVLEPHSRKFFALNGSARVVWERLKEPASVDQVADHLLSVFEGVTADSARQDVAAIVGEMAALGVVLKI